MRNSTTLLYFEDRDTETGHGWRDYPHVLRVDGPDGYIKAFLVWDGEEEPSSSVYASCSYAWITTRESFERTHAWAADELRTGTVQARCPDFQGSDDMEGHFEFGMTPTDMREHLEHLGICNGEKS